MRVRLNAGLGTLPTALMRPAIAWTSQTVGTQRARASTETQWQKYRIALVDSAKGRYLRRRSILADRSRTPTKVRFQRPLERRVRRLVMRDQEISD